MICTTCNRQQDFTVLEWKELMALAKSQGWRQCYKNETWENYCPSCVREWAVNQTSNKTQKITFKDRSPTTVKTGYPCPTCYIETMRQGVVMYDREKEKKVYLCPDCFFREWHVNVIGG